MLTRHTRLDRAHLRGHLPGVATPGSEISLSYEAARLGGTSP